MNIPSSVRILGHDYSVVMDYRLYAKTNAEGDSDSGQNIITLDTSFAESHVAETFLHEIIEAINSRMEMGLEHRILTCLSTGLFEVMRDNRLSFHE